LELAVRAVPHSGRPTKPCALTDSKQASAGVLHSQVLHLHVLCKAKTATAAIGREANTVIRPCLDVECVQRILEVDVLRTDIFNRLKLVVVLSNAADSDTETVVEVRVEKRDIGAVRLG
jgi:hypothetical protein